MKKAFLFFLLMVFVSIIYGQQLKDTIYFTNGTKIIGEVKKIKLGVITFDPDDANDVTVQLQKLSGIAAVRQVFRIETIKDVVYFGRLKPYRIKNYVQVIGAGDSVILHLEEISVLYPFKDSFKQRFSGSAGLGLNFTRSSNFGRINFDGKLNYSSKKEELGLSFNGIYTLTDSSFTRDREDVSLKLNYYFTTTWFATVLVKYQRNLELGLERRYQEGLGAGNKFITTKHVYAWSRWGFVLNQERSTENINSGTLAEVFGQLEFNFFKFTKPEVNFILAQSFYYGLSESGRFRNDGETSLNWEIVKDFKLNLSFYNNYDSKPPGAESKKFDYGIVFGLNYSF